MKKTLRLFGALLCIVLLTMSLSSCDKDDDENDSSIVGTWICENPGVDATMQFYSNGTFYWCEIDSYGDLDEEYGRYQLEGDIIIIRWDSDSDIMRWKLQNDNGKWRIIAQDSTWIKKK